MFEKLKYLLFDKHYWIYSVVLLYAFIIVLMYGEFGAFIVFVCIILLISELVWKREENARHKQS